MKLFEFEAKNLASNLGITTPRGAVASSAEEAHDIHKRLGGAVVVKAQGLVAGRGKAGGKKFALKPEEKFDRAKEMLGSFIKGEKVRKGFIEKKVPVEKKLYIYIAEDRI